MAQSTIHVAIIGGGLAGTILANALMKHQHLDIHLYEAKDQITERGASVGLSINAQRAMNLLGLSDMIKRAEAVTVGCLQLFVGEGPDTGKHVHDVDFGKQTVHRAALLRELLVAIPKDRIHLSKRLSSIQGNEITFEDGTTAVADAIIGADGIHSGVRKFILGEGHPAISPVRAGVWDARAVMSLDKAMEKLGPSCVNTADPHQHIHIGSKGIIFHDFIDDGKAFCVVLSGPQPPEWDATEWTHKLTRAELNELYAGFGEFGQGGLDLLFGDKQETTAFIEWESAEAPTLYNNSMCMIGDAAHACTPYQGAGLSQAIEDSLILETVLGRCKDGREIPLAFEAFDRVRKEHAQKVIRSSREVAKTYFKAHAGGVEALRRDIPSREYILNWDTEGAMKQAIDVFEQLRQGQANGHAVVK